MSSDNKDMVDSGRLTAPAHIKHKILVIDDDPLQISLLNSIFKDSCQVFFEQDSSLAITMIEQVKPDLILLDIEMPGLNGFEVLELIQSHLAATKTSVIFITANDSVTYQLRGLNAGAVDFIVKPFHPSVVEARVNTHLNLKHQQIQLAQAHAHAAITLDSIGDAVITTDEHCHIVYMNPSAELITGHAFDDVKNEDIEYVMPLRIGDNGPAHINPLRLAINEKREVGMALNCQLRNRNGNWLQVEDSASPLVSDTGEVIGGVIVFKDIDEAYAMALKMTHALQHDQLTDLPNRFLLMDKLNTVLEKRASQGKRVGLMQLNINRFNLINQEYGFAYGDSLLQKVAKFLTANLQKGEILSRHSADEFLVIVPYIEDTSELADLAIFLREQLFELGTQLSGVFELAVRIGLSVFPDDADNTHNLILHAEAAVQKAKFEGKRNQVCFYSEEMATNFTNRKNIYRHLKYAIAHDSVVTLYQPMVNSQTGEVEAVEALMRIRNEEGEVLPPSAFIQLAEETGLIVPLGEQMIRNTVAQQAKWVEQGRHIKICINISTVQFRDPNFLPSVTSIIQAGTVDPHLFELEVTESLMLDSLEKTSADMKKIKELGICISIDDFGTGYSCLSYLKDLPVDVLKIDRSFVSEIQNNDTFIIKTIASLAQSMGLRSVAEGVETESQVAILRELQVDLLQGFLFSKPVSADQLQFEFSL